jgi:hypothetical protein
MVEPARKSTLSLYERDFAGWADEQGRALRDRRVQALDWENVAEEIESLSRRDKSEIQNRLIVLLLHLLKWQFQPDRRCHSWQSTIGEQRIHIEGILDYSPSLKRFPTEIFARCYACARREAAKGAKLQMGAFPLEPEFSVEQALDSEFMPGRPWSPEDLI